MPFGAFKALFISSMLSNCYDIKSTLRVHFVMVLSLLLKILILSFHEKEGH